MTQNNLTPKQLQCLQELGGNLNRIRLAKGISLNTVAENTHISQRLLEAIEAGDFDELPEPIYIKGLVAKLARYLEVDDVCFEIDSESNLDEKVSLKTSRRTYRSSFQLRSLHLYLIYILLVIVSVKGITNLVERPVIVKQAPIENIEEVKAPQQPKTVLPVKTTTESETTGVAPQFISQASNSETVSVGINLQEKCWLKVMVDGKLTFEGILPKGTQRQWTGKKEVTIRAGNAGGVVISFNNQQQKILGAPGQVEEITYTVN